MTPPTQQTGNTQLIIMFAIITGERSALRQSVVS